MADETAQEEAPHDTAGGAPVAFFIYNRPELTERVFREIARHRPERLLVIADGPRSGAERSLCEKARRVIDRIDWECEVSRNFADENLGCRRRVSSGLQWVFEKCERAIVLEDDCLPDPGFFPYCNALLERYADEERVMHIGGSNFCQWGGDGGATYRFSRHSDIWGWATWRRAFSAYDVAMKSWPADRARLRDGGLGATRLETEFWTQMFDQTMEGMIDTWDFQWHYAIFRNGGLSCVPAHNLISNLGWGKHATHTIAKSSAVASLPTGRSREMRHPDTMQTSEELDTAFFEARYRDDRLFAGLRRDVAQAERRQARKDPALEGAGRGPLGNSLMATFALTGGRLPREALTFAAAKNRWLSRSLRRLCGLKQFHWLNRRMHRAVLMGSAALSEMDHARLAEHFALDTLLSLGDPSVVLDIGCGSGEFARRVRERHPRAELHAFDPNTAIHLSDADSVKFHRLACGAAPGPATLYKDPAAPSRASLSRDVIRILAGAEPAAEEVERTTVDSFLAAQSIGKVDLLKVTVCGAEWEVLFGAGDAISERRIRAVIFHFGPAQAMTGTPMLYFFDLLERFDFYRMTPEKLTRMDEYDFVTSEVYTSQFLLAVAMNHPRQKAVRDISRR